MCAIAMSRTSVLSRIDVAFAFRNDELNEDLEIISTKSFVNRPNRSTNVIDSMTMPFMLPYNDEITILIFAAAPTHSSRKYTCEQIASKQELQSSNSERFPATTANTLPSSSSCGYP